MGNEGIGPNKVTPQTPPLTQPPPYKKPSFNLWGLGTAIFLRLQFLFKKDDVLAKALFERFSKQTLPSESLRWFSNNQLNALGEKIKTAMEKDSHKGHTTQKVIAYVQQSILASRQAKKQEILRHIKLDLNLINRENINQFCSKLKYKIYEVRQELSKSRTKLSFDQEEGLTNLLKDIENFQYVCWKEVEQFSDDSEACQQMSQHVEKTLFNLFPRIISAELSPDNAKKVDEACISAKIKLKANGKPIDEVFKESFSKFRGLNLFDLITQYLTQLGTINTFDEGFSRKYDSLNSNIEQLLSPSSDQHELCREFIKACLEEMSPELQANIADNIAEYLLKSEYLFLPAPNESAVDITHGIYNLIRLITPYAKQHVSQQQLFAAAFCDDVDKLKACLESQKIHPLIRNAKKQSFLDVVILQNSPKCMKYLFESGFLKAHFESRLWDQIRTPEMYQLFLDHNLPLSQREALSIFTHLLYFKMNDASKTALETILNRFPKLLEGEEGRKILNKLYSSSLKHPDHEKLFIKLAPRDRSLLSPTVLKDMESRILCLNERKWLDFLPEARRIHCETMLAASTIPVHEMATAMDRLKEQLTQQRQARDPEEIDAGLIFDAHTLKRKVKSILKAPGDIDKNILDNLQKSYDQFASTYDEVVDSHPLFAELRFFSREIRAFSKTNETYIPIRLSHISKFLDLWKVEQGAKELSKTWKTDGILIRHRIVKAHQEVMKLPKQQRLIKLMHGTNSAALPVIMQMGEKLMASGKLFQEGVAPLTGEGTGAIGGVNVKGISTLPAEESWEQSRVDISSLSASRFRLAEDYASFAIHLDRPMAFDASKEYEAFEKGCKLLFENRISASALDSFPKSAGLSRDDIYTIFDFKRAIIRLKMTNNEEFMKKSADFLPKLKKLEEQLNSSFIRECLQLCTSKPRVTVNPEDPFIVKKYPMLFATSTYDVKNSRDLNELHTGEIVVNADLALGKDIDLLFTSEEGLEPLSRVFAGKGVAVMSMDAGRYLQMRQLIKSRKKAQSA